jgi:hypothetical protein
MKIKKFNAAVAGAVIVLATVSYFGMKSYFSSSAALPGSGSNVAVQVLAGGLEYSMKDRQVTQIDWRSEKGTMPGQAKLVKWEEGDRVYYQISGPVNKKTLKATNFYDGGSAWGESTEMEIFFERSGGKYDQWLINSENSQILNFGRHADGRGYIFAGSSELPASRYTCELKGDELVTTFWTHKSDTPQNIVFNYNYGKRVDNDHGGAGNLSWVTTGNNDTDYDHHNLKRWRKL